MTNRSFLNTAALLIVLFLLFQSTYTSLAQKGFIVTPSRVDVILPPGSWTTVLITFRGLSPVTWRLDNLTNLDGSIILIKPVKNDSRLVALNVTIIAYRPGFYRYALSITPPVSTQGGAIRAIPVIIVPINVLSPGIRVGVSSIRADPSTGYVQVCYGLTVFGLEKLAKRLNVTEFEVRVEILVDSKPIETKIYRVKTIAKDCIKLGPYEQGSLHRLTLIAEAPGVSRDAIDVSFVVGRVYVSAAASLIADKLQLGFFGGIVRAKYIITVWGNSSLCELRGRMKIDGVSDALRFIAKLGKGEQTLSRNYSGLISVFVPADLLPLRQLGASINLTLYCLGTGKPKALYSAIDIFFLDLGVLLVYLALPPILILVYYLTRRRRMEAKRARKPSEE